MKLFLLLTMGCAFLTAGCAGRPHWRLSQIQWQDDDTIRTCASDEPAGRRITLVLSNYGKRLTSMHNPNGRNMSLYSRQVASEIGWLYHFDPLLKLNGKAKEDYRPTEVSNREAREAMIEYVIERIYPVRMSLRMVREGRRFLLGSHIDSYVQNLKIRRSGNGFELIFERDF